MVSCHILTVYQSQEEIWREMNEEFGVGENMFIFLRRERKIFNQNYNNFQFLFQNCKEVLQLHSHNLSCKNYTNFWGFILPIVYLYNKMGNEAWFKNTWYQSIIN